MRYVVTTTAPPGGQKPPSRPQKRRFHPETTPLTDKHGLAVDAIGNHVDVERQLLSAGYHDPGGLLDMAGKHGLCGDTFALPDHGIIFSAIVESRIRSIEGPERLRWIAALLEHEG